MSHLRERRQDLGRQERGEAKGSGIALVGGNLAKNLEESIKLASDIRSLYHKKLHLASESKRVK